MGLLNQVKNGYKFTEFIGSGGFGSVYKAEKNGEIFAIKVFREDYVLQEYREKGEKNRIQREIDIMKSVDHPFLVKYIDDFTDVDLDVSNYFVVMEFAYGKTLKTLINDGSLTTEIQIVSIFQNILQGIKALHQIRGTDEDKGIIHRDLKPENIMIDGTSIKILDYGLSKVIDYTAITSTGEFLGSPLYSSPEQITDSKNIDKRSDLYTLGVIFYEMLTFKRPYEFMGLPELVYKIRHEAPVPPRKYRPDINNKFENIILKLLEKHPYQRYLNIDQLIEAFESEKTSEPKNYDLTSRFVLRLYDDLSVLKKYILDHHHKIYVEFPAIHQFRQKSLLDLIQGYSFQKMVDPETIRFAYSSYADRQGLKNLPYCPPNFEVISPSYLDNYSKQQKYVKQVLDEEAKLGADILISPYHYTHNTTVVPTYKHNPVEQWFDLDIKLLKESIDYKNSVPEYTYKELYAGIAINGEGLCNETYKNDLLNYYTSYDCDGYMLYVDGIDKDTNEITLFNYIDTLLRLQLYSGKPVIAGRLNTLGLGLLALGLAGYSSGAARFQRFSEDLHTDPSAGYNLYENYYFPGLLGTVPIERKIPTRLNQITQTLGACKCLYCDGELAGDVITANNSKLHFLHSMHIELEGLKSIDNKGMYFSGRINEAIANYQRLPQVFKKEDYKHLMIWQKVFDKFI